MCMSITKLYVITPTLKNTKLAKNPILQVILCGVFNGNIHDSNFFIPHCNYQIVEKKKITTS